ncbi:MAG: PAS domain S-box protein [Betaproteobacteria bacterium]|nr:PAS domain S-box protein [Betaproteobacteria bacterium]
MTFPYRQLSIRTQIFLLALAIVLPVAAMLAWFLAAALQHARDEAHAKVRNLATYAAADLERHLRRSEATLGRLAARPLVKALDPRHCDPIVAEFVRLNPEFTTLGVRDVQGNSVCSYLSNPIRQLNTRDFPWFEEGMRNGKFTAGDAFRGRQVGRWVSVLTHPIRNDEGTLTGLLALPVDLLKFGEDLLASVPKNSVVVVLDRKGTILLRSAEAGSFIGRPAPEKAEDAMRGMREGFLSITGLDGVQRLHTFVTIPGVEWRVMAGLPQDEVFAGYHATLRRSLGIGLGALLLALALAWRIGAAIVRPIADLAAAAASVAAGDNAARAKVAGPAEIESVAQQFNRMLDARNRGEAALRESEVRYRTLVDWSPEPIAVHRDGKIIYVNPADIKMFGATSAQDLIGKPILDFVHPDFRQLVLARVKNISDHGGTTPQLDQRYLKLDGTAIDVEVQSASIIFDGERAVLVAMRDITERKAMEAQRDDERKLLELVARGGPLPDLLTRLVLNYEALFPGMRGSVLLLDPAGQHLLHGAAPNLPPAYCQAIDGVEIGPSVGSCGTAAHTGKTTMVADIASDPLWRAFKDLALAHGLQACWSVPILGTSGRVLGTFAFYFNAPRAALPSELTNIERGAQLASLAIERDLAVAALRESEERFRSLTELSSDWYWEQDVQFRFVRMHGDLELKTGIPTADHIGLTRWDMPALNLSDNDWDAHKAVLQAHLPFRDLQMQRPNRAGRVHWVSISGMPIFDAQGLFTGYRGVGTDISERVQTEVALRESEARNRLFADAVKQSGDAIWTHDLDGIVMFWNEAAAKLFGFSAEEAVGKSVRELHLAGVSEAEWESVRRRFASKAPETYESRRHTKAGNIVDLFVSTAPMFDEHGKHVAKIISMTDISERKRAQAALKESEERYRILVEWTPEPSFVHRDGEMIYVNPAAINMFGATAAHDLVGKPLLDRVHPDFRQIVQARIKGIAEHGVSVPMIELRYLRLDGAVIDAEVQATSVIYDGARAVHVAARDITARKRAEAANRQLEAQLRESQKMEAIGTLAGGIAHDFNNILATILGNAELARQDMSANPLALESVEEIRKAGSRARDLVQQILSFSRRQPTERKRTSLAPVIEESVRLLRATLPARLVLEVHCDADVPAVLADATQIKQVVINLVTNAMQAMRGGPGRIEIRLDTVTLNAALAEAHPSLGAMHARRPGRTVRLAVSDDGPGMDAAMLERIFEPFFTTKPVDEGTGLGLSVAHGIVQGHEGAIVVDSAPGMGASFTLYLPAAETEAGAPQPGESAGAALKAATPQMGGGRHILHLDDDESLVFLVKRLLERRGHRVSSHTDQRAALDALRAHPAGFDLVVTDYNMPGMSGLDVAREVRAIRADLPVAVASGFIDEALRAQAGGTGVRELIFKADAVEEFCEVVQRLVRAVGEKSKSS